jgi:Domain of unknown function (DUF4265)
VRYNVAVIEDSERRVKVRFVLEPENDDWPPVASEGVWARPLSGDQYELDNVPWFARGVAFGDRVRARLDDDGALVVTERLEWSGRYTVRVIPLGDVAAEALVREVIRDFAALGVSCEGALPSYKLVALDIPWNADLRRIKALLVAGETDGRWGYEEGCIDDRWRAA